MTCFHSLLKIDMGIVLFLTQLVMSEYLCIINNHCLHVKTNLMPNAFGEVHRLKDFYIMLMC